MRLFWHRLATVVFAPIAWARGWRWQRRCAAALLTLLAIPLAFHGWYISFGGNFHTVVPGAVYRSAQPSGHDLHRLAASYHIRTILNLRGENPETWYYEECAVARELGVQVVDVGIWATQPPQVDQLQKLVQTLAEAPGAILIHCGSGGDRSGLASALAVLLRSDGELGDARRQLSLYYGHNPYGHAGCHERLLDRYEEWLRKNQLTHTPARLKLWVQTAYSPDECWAKAPDARSPLTVAMSTPGRQYLLCPVPPG